MEFRTKNLLKIHQNIKQYDQVEAITKINEIKIIQAQRNLQAMDRQHQVLEKRRATGEKMAQQYEILQQQKQTEIEQRRQKIATQKKDSQILQPQRNQTQQSVAIDYQREKSYSDYRAKYARYLQECAAIQFKTTKKFLGMTAEDLKRVDTCIQEQKQLKNKVSVISQFIDAKLQEQTVKLEIQKLNEVQQQQQEKLSRIQRIRAMNMIAFHQK